MLKTLSGETRPWFLHLAHLGALITSDSCGQGLCSVLTHQVWVPVTTVMHQVTQIMLMGAESSSSGGNLVQ